MHIPKLSSAISPNYPELKKFVKVTEDTVSEVAIGVFSATFSYGKEALPSLLFHAIHIRFPALIGHINHGSTGIEFLKRGTLLLSLLSLADAKTDPEFYFRVIQVVSVSAILMELTLTLVFPPSLTVQLAVRGIVLFSGIVGNCRTIYDGSCKVHEGLTGANLKTSQKVSLVVSGLISISFGTMGSINTLQSALKLYKGFQVYQTLDQTQQAFALKYHGLDSLGESKSQTAVIISGRSIEWAESGNETFDNIPDPAANVIYNNYKTRVYEVTSAENLSAVLDKASKELGKPIDMLYFDGHANNKEIVLNRDYFFTANKVECDAINKNISDSANVILAGCETARSNRRRDSLTKILSAKLPKAIVTGFTDSLYPSRSWSWFDGKFHMSAWTPDSSDSIIKMFFNGKAIAAAA